MEWLYLTNRDELAGIKLARTFKMGVEDILLKAIEIELWHEEETLP